MEPQPQRWLVTSRVTGQQWWVRASSVVEALKKYKAHMARKRAARAAAVLAQEKARRHAKELSLNPERAGAVRFLQRSPVCAGLPLEGRRWWYRAARRFLEDRATLQQPLVSRIVDITPEVPKSPTKPDEEDEDVDIVN